MVRCPTCPPGSAELVDPAEGMCQPCLESLHTEADGPRPPHRGEWDWLGKSPTALHGAARRRVRARRRGRRRPPKAQQAA